MASVTSDICLTLCNGSFRECSSSLPVSDSPPLAMNYAPLWGSDNSAVCLPLDVGYSDPTQKRFFHRFNKKKKEHICIAVLVVVIVSLLLVITGLSLGLHFAPSKCNSTDEEVTEKKILKSDPCEYDWIWSRGKCYYFSIQSDTWTNSQKFCKSHDASLALIDNKEELDFLFRFKGLENYWIGLRRTDDNKDWTWNNGTLYYESLFNIKRSFEGNIEFAYLNTRDVRSQEDSTRVRWICARI